MTYNLAAADLARLHTELVHQLDGQRVSTIDAKIHEPAHARAFGCINPAEASDRTGGVLDAVRLKHNPAAWSLKFRRLNRGGPIVELLDTYEGRGPAVDRPSVPGASRVELVYSRQKTYFELLKLSAKDAGDGVILYGIRDRAIQEARQFGLRGDQLRLGVLIGNDKTVLGYLDLPLLEVLPDPKTLEWRWSTKPDLKAEAAFHPSLKLVVQKRVLVGSYPRNHPLYSRYANSKGDAPVIRWYANGTQVLLIVPFRFDDLAILRVR